ncbi:MAG: 2-C-methyl-D-erythritol 4-phosphate cytidylyltransferase [Lachnospiraceae bacterium]|nr:2-C-methyl-D-erythritol 4-phosphate cytidylyltransferase [Lachnospiraceae bacterium]
MYIPGGKRTAAIVLAAGRGKRMGSDTPKQFLHLPASGDGGRESVMVIERTLEVFEKSPCIDEILLVTGEDWVDFCRKEVVAKNGFQKVTKVLTGGKERYDSVYAGLLACPDADYVLIHDGARPFVTEEILERVTEAVQKYGAAAAGVPSKDTVKIVDEEGFAASTPDRRLVWNIQTPQAFSYPLIRSAYEIVREGNMSGITDDAMVLERSRLARVKLVMGSYGNSKITTPEDLGMLL